MKRYDRATVTRKLKQAQNHLYKGSYATAELYLIEAQELGATVPANIYGQIAEARHHVKQACQLLEQYRTDRG